MPDSVALLRGINVGGKTSVPMAELRALCTQLGWREVSTYIQSGNVIFRAEEEREELEQGLERAIAERFGLQTAVLVRRAGEWVELERLNPFPEESLEQPNMVMLALAKQTPRPEAASELQERAAAGERVVQTGDALWIHFPNGAGRSKISPVLLDRLVGSPVTTRNWRTVVKLGELVRE